MAQKVIIHSRAVEGFRRGGVSHPAGRGEYPLAQFTPAQLAALQAEPMLSVEIVGEPDPAPAEPASTPAEPAKGKGAK